MQTHERLYRPRPPSWFNEGMVALLMVDTNVVNYDMEEFDLRIPRDLRLLRQLDVVTPYYINPRH